MKNAISSRQNPLFQRIREAIRAHAGEIVIEGPKQVVDAIRAGWKPLARVERGVDFTEVLFDQLSDTRAPQNVIALFERPSFSAHDILARRDTVAVALDAVQDPGNVGTIVRLAAAFDAAGVLLLPGCADPYGPKAIRASVGAILNVPVATIETLNAPNVFYADLHGQVADPPARDAVLVFGNEGAGVSEAIRANARAISIQMSNRVESLNVASSAAILLARSFAIR
jgi:TrmH family RNA methyltransferase